MSEAILQPSSRRLSAGRAGKGAPALWVVLLWLAAVATACGDDSAPSDATPDASHDAAQDSEVPTGNPCEDEDTDEDGGAVECGEGRHCLEGLCAFDTCGDGVKTSEEACDDGNAAIGDGCDPACRIELAGCGDGELAEDEECDDGNVYDVDACSNACTINECTNGRIEALEECDDGNLLDDDECSNACMENRCRNGRVDRGEECDDGNRIHDDGCTNACEIVICGNGSKEGDEECDDGNTAEADSCANACTVNACGNNRLDPGEVCDGDTVEYACADDCSGMVDDDCRPCEDTECTSYQGYDLVAACFEGVIDPIYGVDVDATFVQECIDVVNCARLNGCGFDKALIAVDCYCGSNSVDTCTLSGPAEDAPCVDEWVAATRGLTNQDTLLKVADQTYPSGWAYLMLECDSYECPSVCVPP